ncbi:collagen-like protein [Streptomyces sp. SCSIO ZS0520]|uniref:collagen-like protein n=1 Tax=Streptomyces sp. SCSIO ZS0520 TaxID=2892996 RepID=UPI0021D95C96|nr:collagen-like protein [Streptomyces sp. SCSIO ZS0520]
MRRTQAALAQRWRTLAVAAVLLVLSGAVVLVWLRIDAADRRADQLADEANARGSAVTTLAGDVRVLRAQITAKGDTPAAPDPGRAVEDLPDRAAVPVPIPGPAGPRGPRGQQGQPGTAGTDGADGTAGETGPSGEAGTDGAAGPAGPAGEPGPAGPAGPQGPAGKDGTDGADGRDGQTCPDGYSLQAPPTDPDALVCRRNSTPPEPDPGQTTPSTPGLPADRRRS